MAISPNLILTKFSGYMINHGQEVYISDIPPAVEEVFGNIPQGPQARRVYSQKPPNTSDERVVAAGITLKTAHTF